MKQLDIYDIPDTKAKIYNQDNIIVELDNYDMISAGSITINTFIILLTQLLNPQSAFFVWYSLNKSKIKNVNRQYEDLKGALYFDNDIDTIRSKITKIIDTYQTEQRSVPQDIRTMIKTQVGGQFIEIVGNAVLFIVCVVKYITNDTDEDNIVINDFFEKSMIKYFEILSLIDMYEQLFWHKELILQCYYDNSLITILGFIKYELVLLFTQKYTEYVKKILTGAVETIINDFKQISEKYPPTNYLKLLMSVRQKIFSGLDIANSEELSNKIDEVQNMTPQINIEMTLYVILSPEIADINSFNDELRKFTEQIDNVSQRIKQIRSDIAKTKRVIKLTYDTISEQPKELLQISDLEDRSGLTKPNKRRVFLIQISPQLKYAIKISTNNYPRYKQEGLIYTRFRQIMEDSAEPNVDIIKNQVLKSFFFGNIQSINSSTSFTIYLKKEIGFVVSQSINSDLFDAIKKIANQNNVDEVYYYTTENVIGQWNSLDKLKFKVDDTCILMKDIFKLLTYLNRKYHFIHWDLHPGNIFVNRTDSKQFKIYDFDFSEIESSDSSTNINNTLLDLTKRDEYKNLSGLARYDFGLLYDMYRLFNSFPDIYNSYPCNDQSLKILFQVKEHIHKKYPYVIPYGRAGQFVLYLVFLVDKLRVEKIYGVPIMVWIQNNFFLSNIVGGKNPEFYDRYVKYKYKYLKLTGKLQ